VALRNGVDGGTHISQSRSNRPGCQRLWPWRFVSAPAARVRTSGPPIAPRSIGQVTKTKTPPSSAYSSRTGRRGDGWLRFLRLRFDHVQHRELICELILNGWLFVWCNVRLTRMLGWRCLSLGPRHVGCELRDRCR
jgi:hypothetical protein